jgi:hypothetical protein
MPTSDQLAGIVWGECGGIRDRDATGRVLVLSDRTYVQRLAVAIVVVNRARQSIPWGVQPHTMPPVTPSRSVLSSRLDYAQS